MKIIYHPEIEKAIRSLSKKHGAGVLRIVNLFTAYRFSLTQLFLKKINKEIWELRAGRYRLLFGLLNGDAIIVSLFMKKTQKTPRQLIETAVRRLKVYEK